MDVYVVLTTSVNNEKSISEFSISQEGYDSLEKAQKFCESRLNVYQVDDFNYEQMEEDCEGWLRAYKIIIISVK